MKFINAKQLAFVLDIKVIDARAMMCHAWAKYNRIDNEAEYNEKGKIIDPYPLAMEIVMLAEQLNLPTLFQSVKDIQDNFLKRPGSKKWILCDYPEKELQTKPRNKIKVPSILTSFLSNDDIQFIENEWNKRYGIRC